ncbi:uncharacterized protein DDB_G0290685-like [Solanum pennellii]|uniref:Uncharacterized protein DDB_G0290685-like n=1 Tax=Solanum pennellii TaxID=28526 RepID=A0ABM1VBW0_SOLPN|nr:uncharacterized protein DDB_G0290685-like [Solanum pennellii]XP_027773228.1 uncharacterized protein DDB_G0290685-like [Solanum pennellii]
MSDLSYYYLYCSYCVAKIALIHDYDQTVDDLENAGFFTEVNNVQVAQDEQYIKDGMTLANAYCSNCKELLGWEVIAASQPSRSRRVGGFFMKLKEVNYWNDVSLHDQKRSDNEQNVDQGGGANEQNVDQGEDANEKNVDQGEGANVKNVDLGEGANENNVDLGGGSGTNEQNVDQGEGANEQNVDNGRGASEQNVDQGGGTNEQNVDQGEGANEQNVDQDGGTNERNHDQDSGRPMKRPKI